MANWNRLNRVDVGAQTCGAVTRSASTSCAFGCWTLRSRPAIWCSSSPPPIPTWATDRSVFFPFFFSSSISSVYVSPVVSARVRILHSIHQRPSSQIFFFRGSLPQLPLGSEPTTPMVAKKMVPFTLWGNLPPVRETLSKRSNRVWLISGSYYPLGVIYPSLANCFRGQIGCHKWGVIGGNLLQFGKHSSRGRIDCPK